MASGARHRSDEKRGKEGGGGPAASRAIDARCPLGPSRGPAGGPWAPRLAVAAIILAGAAAYSNSLHGEFIFDDKPGILENETIRTLWPPWGALRPPSETGVSSRPIVNLSLAVNYALGGTDVWGYHVFNVAVHILAALALMGLVRRSLASGRLGEGMACRATPVAAAVAMIWMLHPLQTESVDCIIQRTESLMGLMYLATMYSAARGLHGGGRRWFVAAAAFCALGMACKEVMVTAPILVLLYDRALAGGTFREALRRRGGLYLALALTWGVLAASILTGTRGRSVGFEHGVSSLDYLRTQAGVILGYLRQSFWPDDLNVDTFVPIARSPWEYLPQGAAILLLLAAAGVGVWRNRPWGLAGAWFFLILGPSSSFLPLVTQIAAEHRMYLPLAAIVCVVVLGGFHYGSRLAAMPGTTPAARRGLAVTGVVLAVAVSAALGYFTYQRNEDYRTALSIWTDAVRKQPDNPRALVSLGLALDRAGDSNVAMAVYEGALRADPNCPEALINAGELHMREGRPQAALPLFERLVAIYADAPAAQNNLGVALMSLGRPQDAEAPLRRAAALQPGKCEFHRNLAVALAMLQRTEEALREYDLAIAAAPGDAGLRQERRRLLTEGPGTARPGDTQPAAASQEATSSRRAARE